MKRELNHSWSVSREMDAALGRASAYDAFAEIDAAHRRVAAAAEVSAFERYAVTNVAEQMKAAGVISRADAIASMVERYAPRSGAYEQAVRDAAGGVPGDT